MNKKDIEKDIVNKLTDFVGECPMVQFEYEFDNKLNVFLISYQLSQYLPDTDPFWDALCELEQKMNDDYSIDAPLFSEKNRLFTLSSNANLIKSSPSTPAPVSSHSVFGTKRIKRSAINLVSRALGS